MPWLSGLANAGLPNSEKATGLSLEPPAHWTPSNSRSSIFVGYCRRWFGGDKPGIGNRVWMLPANNNQRITWHRNGVQGREVYSFQIDRKPQDPENDHFSQSMLSIVKKANFFDLILTGDEKWIAFDNTHRGLQWLDSDQVPLRTPKTHKFVKKVMMCVWWNTQRILHHKYWKAARRLIATYTVSSSRDSIKSWSRMASIRQRLDFARHHVSIMTQQKIHELGWTVLPHAQYSPDLAPSYYHLFRSIDQSLRNMQFTNIQHVRKWTGDFIAPKPLLPNSVPKPTRKMQEHNSFTWRILHWLDIVLFFNEKIKIKL